MKTDVLIIGAGPSGSTAAALLNKNNIDCLIVEKQQFPRFVIGESLLPRCMDLLEEADLLENVKAQGYMRKNGAVFRENDLCCEFNFSDQHTAGWDYTFQVPRDHFDKVLADGVAAAGVKIMWNHSLTDVDFKENSQLSTIDDGEGRQITIESKFILDGSGYGRVLPRLLDLEASSTLPVRESIFTHVTGDHRPEGDSEGNIWICILPENSWMWIIPFSNGKTSVGIVARPDFIERLEGSTLDEKLRSAIQLEQNAAKRLADCEFTFDVMKIYGYSAAVKKFCGPGYALLGNATEFLDPVFSSGVTLALESSNRACKALVRQLSGEDIDWQKEYTDYMSMGVETFRTYVEAWYENKLPSIFFSRQPTTKIRGQICSVLAGYVWDESNPCVTEHARAVNSLSAALRIMDGSKKG